MDVFGLPGAAAAGRIQPWTRNVPIGKAIFDFYASQGSVTSAAAINIPSVLDGPGVVVKYQDLTLGHVLSVTNRCRSFTVLVEGNLTVNNGGGISMTARGARGNAAMGLYDGYIPQSIDLASSYLKYEDILAYIKANNIDITDRWFWDDFSKSMGVTATFNQGGALVLLSAAGCGASGPIRINTQSAGYTGVAGTNGGTGSGGGGGMWTNVGCAGHGPTGAGRPYGGGGGTGSSYSTAQAYIREADQYGGPGSAGYDGTSPAGGGAGNPGGSGGSGGGAGSDGTGGILRVIVKGTTTINSGGIIQADGMPGGNALNAGGGGSGGGHVSVVTLGTLTNNGTIRANGGTGGTGGSYAGGAGGAGSVVTKTFAQMGW